VFCGKITGLAAARPAQPGPHYGAALRGPQGAADPDHEPEWRRPRIVYPGTVPGERDAERAGRGRDRRRQSALAGRQDTDAGSGEHHQAIDGLAAGGLAAGDPAAARFGFIVTFAGPGRYPFRCQHPTSAGMADTFAVS
jgi:hypothetical protein